VAETDRRYPMRLFIHGDSYKLFGIFKSTLHLFGAAGDQRVYLLGSDSQGRDLLSRLIIGTRISMTIGLVGVTISFILAIILGGVSGYFGGVADLVIQRFIEILTSLPSLPLWMALAAAIPLNWPITRVFFVITLILSLMGWPILSRELRGKFLALRREDFVISAQLDNATTARLMLRYLVPSALSHIIASGTLAIPNMIIGETALSFLGVGLRAPAISWGVLLQNAINIQSVVMSPWLLFPGLFVIIAVLAFNFLGDGLRDAADPYKS
jgi:peptide/nickel transport system permease protein